MLQQLPLEISERGDAILVWLGRQSYPAKYVVTAQCQCVRGLVWAQRLARAICCRVVLGILVILRCSWPRIMGSILPISLPIFGEWLRAASPPSQAKAFESKGISEQA
jgi:hypothetical protein